MIRISIPSGQAASRHITASYYGSVLPIPNETSFLLNLSDTLLLKAWIQDEDLVRSRIRPKLAELGFDWVLQESERRLLHHVGDVGRCGL